VRTDASGEASLSLPSGIYTVIVKRKGYFGLVIKDFEVRNNAKIEHVLHLKREGQHRIKEKTPSAFHLPLGDKYERVVCK
jgi:hypothetical protein